MKQAFFIPVVSFLTALMFGTHVFAFDDISPEDAFYMATTDPDVFILDVRTPEELRWVGRPGKNLLGEGAGLDGIGANLSIMGD